MCRGSDTVLDRMHCGPLTFLINVIVKSWRDALCRVVCFSSPLQHLTFEMSSPTYCFSNVGQVVPNTLLCAPTQIDDLPWLFVLR